MQSRFSEKSTTRKSKYKDFNCFFVFSKFKVVDSCNNLIDYPIIEATIYINANKIIASGVLTAAHK